MDTKGKRLRLLYPDILGLERGKYLFGDVAEAGHSAFCIGVYPLTHDREILMVPNTQFDVGLHDIDVDPRSLNRCAPAGRRTPSSGSATPRFTASRCPSTPATSCVAPWRPGARWAWSPRSASSSSST